MIEGVDYSTTGHGDWDRLAAGIKAAGNSFVGRYAVNDKSPGGRGIGRAEYEAMVRAGLDVFLYWEGQAHWMINGYEAGVAAAQNAQANIVAAGIPADIPIYFAHDIDPEPQHFAAIDDCLRGCASVVGWDRIGVYGGWLLMEYMAGGGTVKWLCQTLAWEYGRGLHPAACLYQYAFQTNIQGTACDDVRALRENYGQATPPAPPKPVSVYPPGMTPSLAKRFYGSLTVPWADKPFTYDLKRGECKFWLEEGKKQLQPGESYDKATWPKLENVIRRGDGGRDFQWQGGLTYHEPAREA